MPCTTRKQIADHMIQRQYLLDAHDRGCAAITAAERATCRRVCGPTVTLARDEWLELASQLRCVGRLVLSLARRRLDELERLEDVA